MASGNVIARVIKSHWRAMEQTGLMQQLWFSILGLKQTLTPSLFITQKTTHVPSCWLLSDRCSESLGLHCQNLKNAILITNNTLFSNSSKNCHFNGFKCPSNPVQCVVGSPKTKWSQGRDQTESDSKTLMDRSFRAWGYLAQNRETGTHSWS